jgi:hypothetical protein
MSRSGCPVPDVQFRMSSSGCPVCPVLDIPVPFSGYPVLLCGPGFPFFVTDGIARRTSANTHAKKENQEARYYEPEELGALEREGQSAKFKAQKEHESTSAKGFRKGARRLEKKKHVLSYKERAIAVAMAMAARRWRGRGKKSNKSTDRNVDIDVDIDTGKDTVQN